MKIKFLIASGLAVLASYLVTGCNDNSNNSINEKGEIYVAPIPSDADIVVRIDMKSLIEKSDFNNSDLKEYLLKESENKFIKKYAFDFEKMGFDIRNPLYFYSFDDKYVATVFKVKRIEDLKSLVDSCSVFDTIVKEGNKYIATTSGIMIRDTTEIKNYETTPVDSIFFKKVCKNAFVFDSTRGLCIISDNVDAKDIALKLFNNDSCKFVDTKDYEKMCESTKDINLFVTLKKIENEKYKKFKDYKFTANYSFESGEATANINVFTDSTNANKKLDDIFNKCKKTKGEYLDLFNDKCFAYAQIALNEDVVSLIGNIIDRYENFFPRKEKEQFSQIENILKQIDGDMAASWSFINNGRSPVSIKIAAKAKDEQKMRTAIDNSIQKLIEAGRPYAGEKIEKKENGYMLKVDGITYHVGVDKNKNAYINTIGDEKDMFSTQQNKSIKITNDMKKSYGFLIFNHQPIIPLLNFLSSEMGKQMEKINNVHWYVEKNKLVCKIVTNEKENALKTLFDFFDSIRKVATNN